MPETTPICLEADGPTVNSDMSAGPIQVPSPKQQQGDYLAFPTEKESQAHQSSQMGSPSALSNYPYNLHGNGLEDDRDPTRVGSSLNLVDYTCGNTFGGGDNSFGRENLGLDIFKTDSERIYEDLNQYGDGRSNDSRAIRNFMSLYPEEASPLRFEDRNTPCDPSFVSTPTAAYGRTGNAYEGLLSTSVDMNGSSSRGALYDGNPMFSPMNDSYNRVSSASLMSPTALSSSVKSPTSVPRYATDMRHVGEVEEDAEGWAADKGEGKGAQFTVIANVPYDTVRQDLVAEFRRFGRVELAMVVCDEASRHPHKEWTSTAGYAFVRFARRAEAAAAIHAASLGLVCIRGVRVRADWARKDSYAKRGRVPSGHGAPILNGMGVPDGIQALHAALMGLHSALPETNPVWVASRLQGRGPRSPGPLQTGKPDEQSADGQMSSPTQTPSSRPTSGGQVSPGARYPEGASSPAKAAIFCGYGAENSCHATPRGGRKRRGSGAPPSTPTTDAESSGNNSRAKGRGRGGGRAAEVESNTNGNPRGKGSRRMQRVGGQTECNGNHPTKKQVAAERKGTWVSKPETKNANSNSQRVLNSDHHLSTSVTENRGPIPSEATRRGECVWAANDESKEVVAAVAAEAREEDSGSGQARPSGTSSAGSFDEFVYNGGLGHISRGLGGRSVSINNALGVRSFANAAVCHSGIKSAGPLYGTGANLPSHSTMPSPTNHNRSVDCSTSVVRNASPWGRVDSLDNDPHLAPLDRGQAASLASEFDDVLSPCSRGLLAQALSDVAFPTPCSPAVSQMRQGYSSSSLMQNRGQSRIQLSPSEMLRDAVKCCDLAL